MEKMVLRIAHISDLHLFAEPNKTLLGVNTDDSMHAVITLLHKDLKKFQNDLDCIILSGDLSQDGSRESYYKIAQAFKLFAVPVYFARGNHDCPGVIAQVYPCETISLNKQIVHDNWQIIILNSQKLQCTEGFLAESELVFLEVCLRTYPDKHTIIVLHHQPLAMHCGWLDKIGLTNAPVLWKILAQYPQKKVILFGHVHQESDTIQHGIRTLSVPSTCVQFKGNQDEFALENIPPGYRWIELFEDGQIKTSVRRVANYIGEFDANAKGY